MKNYILLILVLFICVHSSAQVQDSLVSKSELRSEILQLSHSIKSIQKDNSELQQKNFIQKKEIDSITSQLSVAQSNIQQIADSLHLTVSKVSSSNKETQNQILNINQTISTRTLYWIIGILLFAFLCVSAFLMLRKNLASNTRDLDSQITKTKQALETEAIKLDSKLIEILQTQLNILKEERKSNEAVEHESDHKLPLKVGEEIHRMRKRIENMPQEIKGLSALSNSLKRLEEEFNEGGYEIEELLGRKYTDGMKVEARFVANPDIPKGEERITEVLKPEIKYKGIVIQTAKVEVGKSY